MKPANEFPALRPRSARAVPRRYAVAVLLAALGLAGCGGDGGGDDTPPVTPQGQPPPVATTCIFDQSKFDDCKIAQ